MVWLGARRERFERHIALVGIAKDKFPRVLSPVEHKDRNDAESENEKRVNDHHAQDATHRASQ
jgi:hypothetical protein